MFCKIWDKFVHFEHLTTKINHIEIKNKLLLGETQNLS